MAPPAWVAHLEAVVGRRVVAGGDVDRAQSVQMHDLEGDGRGRRRPHAEMDWDAVAGQHLGRGQGKGAAGEALVVAQHHAARQLGRLEAVAQVAGKALRAAPHVVEGIVLADALRASRRCRR